MDCNYNQLSGLPTLPNSLKFLFCSDNPFNLWEILIDPSRIHLDFAEFICKKLSVLDKGVKQIQRELKHNKYQQYNKKMFYLKITIDKILSEKMEIIVK